MKSFARLVALALLTGCAGAPPQLGPPMLLGQSVAPAKGGDLLYVTTPDETWIFTFPKGKFVGNFGVTGAQNPCSDRNGNVFIPQYGPDDIVEIAHGGEAPIATLDDTGEVPESCSSDPTTGNLAVANFGFASAPGNVAIYQNAQGTPALYSDSAIYYYWFCGYDDRGNLFVDGINHSGSPVFAELPRRGGTFRNITLNERIKKPGSVQWDGTYITITDERARAIDRVKVSGSRGTIVGTTMLDGWRTSRRGEQSWLQGGTAIVSPDAHNLRQIGFWPYPAGGNPTKIITGYFGGTFYVDGETVSVASGGQSWMSPTAKAIRELLYVSDWATDKVFVYNYATGSPVGTLAGFKEPFGQCVDKAGDVWIADYEGLAVVEYAHGGSKPMKRLTTDGFPVGCSIDPATGNLAVGNDAASGAGDIEIWKNASGSPADYSNEACYRLWQPGYDSAGNLYAEVETKHFARGVCEIPAGATSLATISTDATIDFPGGVMWDGKYITLSDQQALSTDGDITAIYQAKRTGSGLRIVGSTDLYLGCEHNYDVDVVAPFIVGTKNTPANNKQGTVVAGANVWCPSTFEYWAYPAGGRFSSELTAAPVEPYGQSVSISE
ncbi:MAG TPA: hypothetical protein VKR56_11280 [Candidatus Cybelea sp.]|nr:hypothetical protein [Candidatus Cybelea sp.]